MMLEIIDLIFPIIAVAIFLILNERWKKKYELPLKKHVLIVLCKITICTFSALLILFVFGYLLNATEVQLLLVLAIGIGSSYAVTSYLFKPLYFKK
ncbi:hypothetical protein [Thalassomonas viridans]|uniref:hypothetical protein n=1 Tax=Thalassomonas viridans TaxID=137584 RepID=UPI00236287E4|nr:hypothetical protein [Thalassomonas viridans]